MKEKTLLSRLPQIIAAIVSSGLIFGLLIWVFASGSQPIEESREKAWQKDFKGALNQTCVESTEESLQKKGLEPKSLEVRRFERSYCDCLLDRVEKAHAVATEYKGLNTEQVLKSHELVRNFDHFLQSHDGLEYVRLCEASALSEFSSGEEVGSNQVVDTGETL